MTFSLRFCSLIEAPSLEGCCVLFEMDFIALCYPFRSV
jgi:hypothetical protein